MPISLRAAKPQPQARPKRRGRRRRSYSFDTTLAQPAYRLRPPRPGRRSRAEPYVLGENLRPSLEREVPKRTRVDAQPRPSQAESSPLLSKERIAARRFLVSRWWALLLLGTLLGGVAYGYADSRFFVYHAEIKGVRYLDAQAIYRAAGVDKQSVFWIDPQGVAQRIIALDGVKAVRVRCSLPAVVSIEVEEREPTVLWRSLPGKHDWWLDAEGVVLPYNGDPYSERTVFVVDASDLPLRVGDSIQPEGLVQSVLRMAAVLPGARVFYYEAERGLSFSHQTGSSQWPVFVGTGEDLQRKIQVVQVLTKYLVSKGIRPSYVDVRWADRPLYGMPTNNSVGGGN